MLRHAGRIFVFGKADARRPADESLRPPCVRPEPRDERRPSADGEDERATAEGTDAAVVANVVGNEEKLLAVEGAERIARVGEPVLVEGARQIIETPSAMKSAARGPGGCSALATPWSGVGLGPEENLVRGAADRAVLFERSSGSPMTMTRAWIFLMLVGCSSGVADSVGSAESELTPGTLAQAQAATIFVYYGPRAGVPGTTCPACADSVVDLVTRLGYRVERVYADQVTFANLARARLFVWPGGGDDSDATFDEFRAASARGHDNVAELRRWVHDGGGRYLGLCMGAYLAGHSPQGRVFDLLNGADTDAEAESSDLASHAVTVRFTASPATPHHAYYQAGPYFTEVPRPGGVGALRDHAPRRRDGELLGSGHRRRCRPAFRGERGLVRRLRTEGWPAHGGVGTLHVA